jgi:MoxR-like ATPase
MKKQVKNNAWQDLAKLMEADTKRVILYGNAGTGKTYAGLTAGNPINAFRLICSEEMTDADIVGNWEPNSAGKFSWREGSAIKAWRTGGRLVIDEIDKANGDVLAVLMAMTDTVDSSSWQNPETGEIVKPHENYSVFMTTNVMQMSDLPTALVDRFPIALCITEPHPMALERLPQIYRETARTMAGAEGNDRASMRAFLELVRLEAHIGRAEATRLIFGEEMAEGLVNIWNIAELAGEEIANANNGAVMS